MYDVRERKLIQSYVNLFNGPVTSFTFHPSGDFAVCVSEETKIKILDLIEGRPIFTLYGPRKGIGATAFNANGNLFATGGKDEEVLIWEPTLLPYESAKDDEEQTEKENIGGSNVDSSSSTTTSEEKSSKSATNSKSKVDQTPAIVKSNSKNVSLDSLSRTSSATSTTPSSASSTS